MIKISNIWEVLVVFFLLNLVWFLSGYALERHYISKLDKNGEQHMLFHDEILIRKSGQCNEN